MLIPPKSSKICQYFRQYARIHLPCVFPKDDYSLKPFFWRQKMKSLSLVISSLCISGFMSAAHAADYYSNPVSTPIPNNAGYSSSVSSPGSNSHPHSVSHPHRSKHVSISVNLPSQSEPAYYRSKMNKPHFKGPQWIDMWKGNPLPAHAVVGGNQPQFPHTLLICRGEYRGGVHPGKLLAGSCNISWGGNEIRLNHYQVLVSRIPLGFASVTNGYIPANAIQAGHEQGRPLFACQAEYRGGMHPGKVVGNACNIGWGGREVSLFYYNVLVG